ncbi:HEPN domain-containing protein [Flavilitoribacter nigricans]|uniref:Uncharacterized protein n=1 Tax=Flavilitoribacter nigricans (strain ATCC 23147 / DSM 23189 / NBRC 102662 / NCIMB 1420 / SS-2) TaxID=1122177 RepID=A0A2D0N7D4_FLAN2|nr:HEPN domain-containing protein [Flavilitoribacter nigricans]PHN04377.1 hypothetical protein CRP01_22730 [Flavilitoribacter nigricans DSM 23189 = NBRC 102662]
MFYQYPVLTKTPYREAFVYRDVFQIFPDEDFNEEIELGDYHHMSLLEVDLGKFYELFQSYLDIGEVLKRAENLRDSGIETINLEQAAPLIMEDHFVLLPKYLITKLLTVFTNFHHFDYSGENEDGWFRILPPNGEKIQWGKKWLPRNRKEITAFSESPRKGIEKVSFDDYSKRVSDIGDKINYPLDIERRFDAYFELDKESQDVFNDSVVFFNQAINIQDDLSSLAIVSLVTSIEGLVNLKFKDFAVETCDCCGQNRYRTTRKFNDFVKENSIGFYSKSKIRKMIGDIYARRSSIVHTGKLFAHERGKPIWEKGIFQNRIVLIGALGLVRYILNYWILNNPTDKTTKAPE